MSAASTSTISDWLLSNPALTILGSAALLSSAYLLGCRNSDRSAGSSRGSWVAPSVEVYTTEEPRFSLLKSMFRSKEDTQSPFADKAESTALRLAMLPLALALTGAAIDSEIAQEERHRKRATYSTSQGSKWW